MSNEWRVQFEDGTETTVTITSDVSPEEDEFGEVIANAVKAAGGDSDVIDDWWPLATQVSSKQITYEVRDHDTEIDYNTGEPLQILYRCEDGKPVEEIGSDGGEPEDNSFARDWKWVAPALLAAYALGRKGNA